MRENSGEMAKEVRRPQGTWPFPDPFKSSGKGLSSPLSVGNPRCQVATETTCTDKDREPQICGREAH